MLDVIVAGGGPAGATAAGSLAAGGADVLLLEKEIMPRSKPCGGVIPAIVPEMAGIDPDSLDAVPLHSLTFTWDGREPCEIPLPPGGILSVSRDHFDHLLFKSAESAGARTLQGRRVERIIENNEYIQVVDHTGAVHRARYLLAAWGTGGPVLQGFHRRGRTRVAFSGVCRLPRMSAREKKASLDLGVLGGGYAGIIDKGTHLILGYYLRGNRLHKDFLERMAGYCEAFSLEFGGEKFVHKVLPLYSRDAPIARGRIFLLGDAGGLVDPLSGEGIRHAVKSGLLASRVVLEGLGAAKYDALIRQEIGTELVLAWKLAGFAYRFPRVAQQGMVRVGFEAVEVLNGRQTYLHLLERLKARIRRTFGLETSRKR